jgi:hypothetical protein
MTANITVIQENLEEMSPLGGGEQGAGQRGGGAPRGAWGPSGLLRSVD